MAENNDAKNVSTAKPVIAGAIFTAPLGTTIPTKVSDTLDTAFKNIGFISDDGWTNSRNITTEKKKAWGNQTVYNAQTDATDDFKFKMLEYKKAGTKELIYGKNHVTVDTTTGEITTEVTTEEPEHVIIVIDEILSNGAKQRTVVFDAQLSALGDITHADNELLMYDVTYSALPDANGVSHKEYLLPKTH